MPVSRRELANLQREHMTNGSRGLHKPSAAAAARLALMRRIRSLFHEEPRAAQEDADWVARRPLLVHSEPNVYVVPHFLSARELDHIDDLITSRRHAFKHSHTDSSGGDSMYSQERTSDSLFLPKAADATLRAIESRAADLVGLPSDHVEPLQVVHYSEGAHFDMHHDVCPIKVRDDNVEGAVGRAAESTTFSTGGGDGDAGGGDGDAGGGDGDAGGGDGDAGGGDGDAGGGDGPRGLAPVVPTPGPVPRASPGKDSDGGGAAHGSSSQPISAECVTVEAEEGPRRLVTLFVYLNTLPEGVGHTEFPLLRGGADNRPFSVRPRCGTALLFCNVDSSGEPDVRVCHRACPVDDGHQKYGVNIWSAPSHAPNHRPPHACIAHLAPSAILPHGCRCIPPLTARTLAYGRT